MPNTIPTDEPECCDFCGEDMVDCDCELDDYPCGCDGVVRTCTDCDPDGTSRHNSRGWSQADWAYRRAEAGHGE